MGARHRSRRGTTTCSAGRRAGLTAALRKLSTTQAAERLAAGPAYTATGYVLVDELGRPQRTDPSRRRAYEVMEKAAVRKVRLYDARQPALTYLAVNGVPPVIVSAWAGRSDLSLAARV